MSVNFSSDGKKKSRIQSSEALKNIFFQQRRIHKNFEKKIPKVIANSLKSHKKIHLTVFPYSNLSTQVSPPKAKSINQSLNEDLTEALMRKMNKTTSKFSNFKNSTKFSSRIRQKAATPDIFYAALNTGFKPFTAKRSCRNLKTQKQARRGV